MTFDKINPTADTLNSEINLVWTGMGYCIQCYPQHPASNHEIIMQALTWG